MKVYLLEAVDPEERNLRLNKVMKVAKRAKGAHKMAPTSNPIRKEYLRYKSDHAFAIAKKHKPGYTGTTWKHVSNGARQNKRMYGAKIDDARKQHLSTIPNLKKTGKGVDPESRKLRLAGVAKSYRKHLSLTGTQISSNPSAYDVRRANMAKATAIIHKRTATHGATKNKYNQLLKKLRKDPRAHRNFKGSGNTHMLGLKGGLKYFRK